MRSTQAMDRARRHSFGRAGDERTGHRDRPYAACRGGRRRSRATSGLAGRGKPFRMLGLPACSSSGRQSGHRRDIAKARRSSLRWTLFRQSSDYPSHLGRSRSVRAPVDGVAVCALVGVASASRCTQFRSHMARDGPVSCSAVTLRLAHGVRS